MQTPREAFEKTSRSIYLRCTLLGLVWLFLINCSPGPPAEVLHLLPKGIAEKPLMSGQVTRMGFASPVGGYYHVSFDIPARPSELVLACAMLPERPDGTADEAVFTAELRSHEGDPQLIFEGKAGFGSWTESVVDLAPYAGQQMELFFESRPAEPSARGFACWATPYMVVSGGPRPNVLLISLDALRADHLGTYGYIRPTSPTLDSLATRGYLFERAVSQAPWTLPAHASLFTSHYLKSHGITNWQEKLGADAIMLAEVMRFCGYVTGAIIGGALPPKRGFSQGFDSYDSSCFDMASEDPVTNHCTHQKAVEWLRRRANAPFFLFLHYWDIHDPYIPPAPYDTLFDPDYDGTVDPWETLYGWRALRQKTPGGARGIAPRDLEHIVALYDGEIAHTDRYLSKLFTELRRLKLHKKTLIIVTSDHGDEFLEHGRTGHGKTLFRELINVPLIWAGPGRTRGGRRIETAVQTVDIMPSILDFLAVPAPPAAGVSFLPLLRGEDIPSRPAFSEVVGFSPREGSQYAVVSGGTKVILSTQTGRMEAYNLETDPKEKHPRDLDSVPMATELGAALESFIESAVLEIRVTGLGAKEEFLVSLKSVPPLSISPWGLEVQDSLAYNRYTKTLEFWFDSPLGDVDGVTVELPLTAHVHEFAATHHHCQLPVEMVHLGDGSHPDSMPYRFQDRDPRLYRSSQEMLDSVSREPRAWLWLSSQRSSLSERAEPNMQLEQQLRALGYLE